MFSLFCLLVFTMLKNGKISRNLIHSNSTFFSKSRNFILAKLMALDFSRNLILAKFSEDKVEE